MSPRPPSTPVLLAPGPSGAYGVARAPGRHETLPAVDERLVAPESRAEIIDGQLIRTMGSNQPHGTRHFDAAGLFFGLLADGYSGAVDMLTRADEDNDAAPDVSVFPSAPDPATGGRQLEEIALEVLDTERMAHATRTVEKFAARGVRRLFAVRVANRAVYEWNHAHRDWEELGADAVLEDRCFRGPFPVAAFVDRVVAEEAIARALLARRNRVLVAAMQEERERGHQQGHQQGRELGHKQGRDDGALATLEAACVARLGRALSEPERASLARWYAAEGLTAVTTVAVTAAPEALAARLAH